MPTLQPMALLLFLCSVGAACSYRARPAYQPVNSRESRAAGVTRAPSLVGVWRVAKFCDDDSTGALTEPYGSSPRGYLIYAPTGQLSIHLMRTPPVRPFAGGDDRPTETERRDLLDAYFGYYGTYTIISDSAVVHHVEGGTLPSYIGTDQSRVYRIRGDTLTLGGSPSTWHCRAFLRVK
jgi:lipocalin-like protein